MLSLDKIFKVLKNYPLILVASVAITFFTSESQAQYTEFGGGLGLLTYTGDLSPRLNVRHIAPGGFGFYRMNVNNVTSLKLGLAAGKLQGSDERPIDVLAENRGYSFDITLIEGSAVMEYYFLDYKHPQSRIRWSPYFFAGFGIFRFFGADESRGDFSKLQPVVPFGVGVKQLVGKRYAVSGEFGLRKTFFDYLDSVSDADPAFKNYQYGNPSSKDWYYFLGLSFTYILYEIPCPFRYVPNRYEYN